MKNFHFQLESLLRYRRHRRDLCRQLLAEVLANEDRLRERRAELVRQRDGQLDEIRRLHAPGEVDIDRSAARRFYAGQMKIDLLLAGREQTIIDEQLARCRQALLLADREVKALEKLRDTQRARHQYEQDRRQRRELDETWMAAHLAEGVHR